VLTLIEGLGCNVGAHFLWGRAAGLKQEKDAHAREWCTEKFSNSAIFSKNGPLGALWHTSKWTNPGVGFFGENDVARIKNVRRRRIPRKSKSVGPPPPHSPPTYYNGHSSEAVFFFWNKSFPQTRAGVWILPIKKNRANILP